MLRQDPPRRLAFASRLSSSDPFRSAVTSRLVAIVALNRRKPPPCPSGFLSVVYYYSKDKKLLVSDYMSAGSLSALLHGNATIIISISKSSQIC
ncbi:putative inactive receptor kinase [Camellia lanceoleosa]|uniref:Inactive receptor kinase n=1 Tax=Camellia lanceoleosa TaxID=1840588 RepID=A0ACC0J3V3_9ERIC|nr:putative inactive receptor kinase [Camellia lanceoleosa]